MLIKLLKGVIKLSMVVVLDVLQVFALIVS